MRSLAVPNLYTYCLYIDSACRLQLLFLQTLFRHAEISQSRRHSLSDSSGGSGFGLCIFDLQFTVSKPPYLAPFTGNNIDFRFVKMIVSLFKLLSPSLVRLVVDIPFRAQTTTDHTIRPRLREAFLSLTALEEFTNAGNEPWFNRFLIGANRFTHEPPVWLLWPRLECLALYDVDFEFERPDFTERNDRVESIETVVLTCADGKEEVSTSSLPHIKGIK